MQKTKLYAYQVWIWQQSFLEQNQVYSFTKLMETTDCIILPFSGLKSNMESSSGPSKRSSTASKFCVNSKAERKTKKDFLLFS